MLEELRANIARHRLTNVTCIPAAWGEVEIVPHDLILVANVAPIFKDLHGFLTAAEPLARRAIALVQNVGPGAEKFYLGELYPLLLGRPYPAREDYLRTVTLLHGLGIYTNVSRIPSTSDCSLPSCKRSCSEWDRAWWRPCDARAPSSGGA
jgi:hypothetical protein